MSDRDGYQRVAVDEFDVTDDFSPSTFARSDRKFTLRQLAICLQPRISPSIISWTGRRRNVSRTIYILIINSLAIIGLIRLISFCLAAFLAHFPVEIDFVIDHWGKVGYKGEGLAHWPTDFSGGIEPAKCHSHNDYWNAVPLYEAIHFGCVSVEADIWLVDGEIYVGHTQSSLSRNRTLRNLYIDPLIDIIDGQNPLTTFSHDPKFLSGVFDTQPNQTLVLLIDFKSAGNELWPYVHAELSPLRDRGYLTNWNGVTVVNGPITVVASGNAPYNLIVANETYRDIFYDAPLESFKGTLAGSAKNLGEVGPSDSPFKSIYENVGPEAISMSSGRLSALPYNFSNSYYASVSFQNSIGHLWRSHLSQEQLESVRKQIRGAHEAGLKVRYWGIPSWPRGLRNHVWHILIREGVDILNTDDLKGATLRDWRRGKGWWF